MPTDVWCVIQSPVAVSFFIKINSGAAPKPCPMVVLLVPSAVYLTTLKPAFVFACTVLVILPSVLLLVVPPFAFQHHAT